MLMIFDKKFYLEFCDAFIYDRNRVRMYVCHKLFGAFPYFTLQPLNLLPNFVKKQK